MQILERINRFVWGVPALVLIIGVGIFLSVCTGFAQITLFPNALKNFIKQFAGKKEKTGSVSPYQALCTALAATVGTGNIAGVAGAIAVGGPGSIFWMWICAVLGMVTKFAEATLAVRYRVWTENGSVVGGPMYIIKNGMGKRWHWLATIYCFFTVVACFGVGNATQINAVIGGMNSVINTFGGHGHTLLNLVVGVVFAVLISVILSGGAKRIGRIAEGLVPFASVSYLLLGVVVLIIKSDQIPYAFASIIQGAFSPKAVTGGVLGSAFTALRVGASRGVFTNEAGMGTAAIAHASADVEHPVQQGLMGIIEVFLDTIVICTMTAFVILCSGVTVPYGTDIGAVLTTQAFSEVIGNWVSIPISLALCCFATATILGWGLYGVCGAQYLFGEGALRPFIYLQATTVVLGAILKTGTVWTVSEIVNGLMAIPNLIAIAYLSSEIKNLTKDYKRSLTQFGQASKRLNHY